MRRFLYISPYFPPQRRVGALRPLKFARHLPALGWAPTVLTQAPADPPSDAALLEALPPEVELHGGWGRPPGVIGRWLRARFPSGDVIPLGHHRLDLAAAGASARALLARDARLEAIVVNADPYAALVLGAELSRETGLPLIQDLRDPWSPCEVRRPHRDRLRQRWIERLERAALAPAAAIVLNTETARADYRRAFPDIPPERFHVIRNHGDPTLVAHGAAPRFSRFTALFLGGFRRFVEGVDLLEALAALPPETELDLVVTGAVPESTRSAARSLGVERRLHVRPPVPLTEVGPWMDAADLLVVLSNATRQRIPAKVFEYATSSRPILAVHDNPELEGLLAGLGGAASVSRGDREGLTRALAAAAAAGRGRTVARSDLGLDSARAAAALAELLDRVTGGRR